MRRASLLLAASFVLAAPLAVRAEAPKAVLRGPTHVAPDSTIVLDARASVADRPLRWKLDGPPDVPLLVLDQDGRKGVVALVPSVAPGVYRFTLIARGIPAGEVELDADAAVWVVTVGPPSPPPAPNPPPPGPPTPTPAPAPSGTLHVSLVVDLEAMNPALATLREGLLIRPALRTSDAVFRTYASASSELTRLNLAPIVTRIGAPCLIVQDAAGKVIFEAAAPPDEAAVIATVKTLRGDR